jgi:hypothetical protein
MESSDQIKPRRFATAAESQSCGTLPTLRNRVGLNALLGTKLSIHVVQSFKE